MDRFAHWALLTFASVSILAAAPKVGDPALAIHFDRVFPEQPVANAGFEKLAGKAVVLEMWATWCGPCVAAIPHLNELAEKLKDAPIVFLSVSDEDPDVVERFLKKRPLGGMVGVAHTESPMQRYGADSIPTTFLIDAGGKIAGCTDPELVTVPMLEQLMARQRLPAIDLTIRPYPTGSSIGIVSMRNGITMSQMSLRLIIANLWDIRRQSRISGVPLDDSPPYDVSLSIPVAAPGEFQSRAQDVIAAAFGIRITRATRNTEAWILTKPEGKPPALLAPVGTPDSYLDQGSQPPRASMSGWVKVTNAPMEFIAGVLEAAAGKPVIDETGIAGNYDFRISWEEPGPEGLMKAVRKAGFQVEVADRAIDYLVVTSLR